MDELCPLCLKMGSNKRIKAIQISLDEAVWMCENEECPWPFGYEPPNFLSRKVGVEWSNEWEIYRKVQKRVGPIPVSTELSLYTPPVTPSSDTATKESAKTDYSGERSVSARMSHVGEILASSDDSYAPKSSRYDGHATNETGRGPDSSDATVFPEATNSSAPSRKAPVPQSIFDIDVAVSSSCEDPTESCSEPRETDVSAVSRLQEVRNPSNLTETVLKPSEDTRRLSEESSDAKEKEIIVPAEQEDEGKKTMPQIRSISVANIDLQLMDHKRAVKDEANDFLKSTDFVRANISDTTEQADSPRKANELDSPEQSEPRHLELASKDESVFTTQQRTPSSRQRMATITVDGPLPVILSYDLTDLEGKSGQTIPATSTPVRECTAEDSFAQRKDATDTVSETSVESPQKRIRPAPKRRALLLGKQYEKFSFSKLKKFVPASKDQLVRSSSTIVPSNTRRTSELEKTSVEAEHSLILDARIEPSDNTGIEDIPDVAHQQIRTSNSGNADSGNARIVSDDPIVESLNLSSVLDDILIDGYQNATESLNDDWLESFFT